MKAITQIILICLALLSFFFGLWPVGLIILLIVLINTLSKKMGNKKEDKIEQLKKRIEELEKDRNNNE